jgi:hypothetical protein
MSVPMDKPGQLKEPQVREVCAKINVKISACNFIIFTFLLFLIVSVA